MTAPGPRERGEYLKNPYHDPHHDPYFVKRKYKEPAVCQSCGVTFHGGVFAWADSAPAEAEKMTCPACLRIADKFEGGVVTLSGVFLGAHKDEIMNLVRHTEELEKQQRPLERIMLIGEDNGTITVKTTYEHLARRIGDAIFSAYDGDLKFSYSDSEKYIRVSWSR